LLTQLLFPRHVGLRQSIVLQIFFYFFKFIFKHLLLLLLLLLLFYFYFLFLVVDAESRRGVRLPDILCGIEKSGIFFCFFFVSFLFLDFCILFMFPVILHLFVLTLSLIFLFAQRWVKCGPCAPTEVNLLFIYPAHITASKCYY
jgi:hypothetical protein